MICHICKTEFKQNQFGIHIRVCRDKHQLNESIDYLKFKQLCFHYDKVFDKAYFYKLYVDDKKSVLELSQILHIVYSHVVFLLKYFDITIRTLKAECNNVRTREKYVGTIYKKYGVPNISQCSEIKEKKRQTFLKNYGVDNIYKDPNFKKWILENNFAWNVPSIEENEQRIEKQTISIIKFWYDPNNKDRTDKIKQNNKLLTQKWWNNLNDEQKNSIIQKRKIVNSRLESKISEILMYLNIGFSTQKFINRFAYDFLINSTKILIEVNGDFWHANPDLYEPDFILHHPNKRISAKDLWNKDLVKKINAEKEGYTVIYIWESEIRKKTDNELIELIFSKLDKLKTS
jgi:very-short-patch-repair endonuclease